MNESWPTIEQFMADKIVEIRVPFTIPMRVTIIVRSPLSQELELIFSDDDQDELIAMLQRRRDQVVTSQRDAVIRNSEP